MTLRPGIFSNIYASAVCGANLVIALGIALWRGMAAGQLATPEKPLYFSMIEHIRQVFFHIVVGAMAFIIVSLTS